MIDGELRGCSGATIPVVSEQIRLEAPYQGGGQKGMVIPNQTDVAEFHLAQGADLDPSNFPSLCTFSAAAFAYQFTPVAKRPAPPEVVFLPTYHVRHVELVGILASWNYLWEAAQHRKEVFREDRFGGSADRLLDWIDGLPTANIYLVPETRSQYDAYAPLLHLLPKRVLDRHGLPALRSCRWPTNAVLPLVETLLPSDFSSRLSRAFAQHVWHISTLAHRSERSARQSLW